MTRADCGRRRAVEYRHPYVDAHADVSFVLELFAAEAGSESARFHLSETLRRFDVRNSRLTVFG